MASPKKPHHADRHGLTSRVDVIAGHEPPFCAYRASRVRPALAGADRAAQLAAVTELHGIASHEWRPDPKRPYRARFRGPVVLLGVRRVALTLRCAG